MGTVFSRFSKRKKEKQTVVVRVYCFCKPFFLCNLFSRACIAVYRQDGKRKKNIEKNINKRILRLFVFQYGT